ncbi:MAG: polysaccharide pyruvyl transferase CsaB [Oscillospiraceae bacterium]|nr:polysaccharide pyruvyl transferase CsaB [Oscillospiraceae bacterium]
MSKKILMALMGLEIGGAETHVVELSKELARQGFEIVVASNGGVYEKELTEAGIRHYQVPMHRRTPSLMLRSLFALRRIIREEKPDLVHAHARIPAFLCGILHRHMHFPFVTSAHWVFDTSGMLRHLTDWGEKTVAVSEDIKQYLMDNYGVPEEDIFVTINGIDTDKFSPDISSANIKRELGIAEGEPVISYVSRMDESRALVARQLIAIAPKIVERIPGVRLLIVGGGDVYDELLKKANETNELLGYPCILMPGARTDINEVVAAGDIFIGVSRAALEAMAAAKAVIVAGNEGYIGLFDESKLAVAQENNFCCRGCADSTEALLLADVLHAMCDLDENARAALGAYGREVIFSHYSVRRMALDCVKAYDASLAIRTAPRILISGYYGFQNLGDDAILLAVRRQIAKIDPAASLVALSNRPAETRARYDIDAIGRFDPFAVWREMRRCDCFISGGGSLLQDHTSTRSLLYYTTLIRMAKHYKKPVMFYANGIGPVHQSKNRDRVRDVAQMADIVTLRDMDSQRELLEMGAQGANIRVTADPVYALECADAELGRAALREQGVPTDRPLVGISVRFADGMEEHMDEFAVFCDAMATRATPVFIVMQTPSDRAASEAVRARMKEASCIVDAPYEPQRMMAMLACMDAAVTMRLHSLIFAAKQRVPVLGVVYDPKVASCLDELSMPSAGTLAEFDAKRALAMLYDLLDRRGEYAATLDTHVCELERRVEENADCLRTLLEKK